MDQPELTDDELKRNEKDRRAKLTRRAMLYGSLAVAALIICALNVVAIVGAFWKPSQLFVVPLYMMFAAVSLWASVNFSRTRVKLLIRRDAPDELDGD